MGVDPWAFSQIHANPPSFRMIHERMVMVTYTGCTKLKTLVLDFFRLRLRDVKGLKGQTLHGLAAAD